MKELTVEDIQRQIDKKKLSQEEIVDKVNNYLTNNEIQQAFPYAAYLAQSDNNSVSTLMTTGMIALMLNKQNDAKEYFTTVLNNDPANFDASYNLTLMDIGEEKYTEAFEKLTQLSKLYPENADLYNDLAVVTTDLDNPEQAYSFWEKALSINPNDSRTRNNALDYFLENNLLKEGTQLLSQNKISNDISEKTKIEIDHWQQIIDSRISEVN